MTFEQVLKKIGSGGEILDPISAFFYNCDTLQLSPIEIQKLDYEELEYYIGYVTGKKLAEYVAQLENK